jgi:hypothetical protein
MNKLVGALVLASLFQAIWLVPGVSWGVGVDQIRVIYVKERNREFISKYFKQH